MLLRRFVRPALAGAVLLIGTGGAQADSAALLALKSIERGQWQLREGGATPRQLCLSNPAVLLQIQHAGAQCEHRVVENSATTATITYSCPGHGHGRTTVSVETPRLVRIDTQGVADGAPFAAELEGRRTGTCG
jgi:hypothetical protein